MGRRFLLISMLWLIPSQAFALDPMPGEDRFSGVLPDQKTTAGAALGIGQIDEDFFLTLTLAADLNLGKIGLGIAAPLNLRVVDMDPENEGDYLGLIRKEDWDEPIEYLRIIRYVRYGHKRDPLFLRVGTLAAEIGHGTIMSRYMNNLDLNTNHIGAQFDVNTDWGGVETVVSDGPRLTTNISDIGAQENYSRIVGGRFHLKPWALVDPESCFNIFAVGLSFLADVDAPLEVSTDDGWAVAQTDTVTVYGVDAEVEVFHNALLDVVPYTDLNFIGDAGWGWHLGARVKVKVPIGINLVVPARIEYRRFRSGYRPIYFSSFYDIERSAFPLEEGTTAGLDTKQGFLEQEYRDSDEGLNGYYADAALDFVGLFQVAAIYEDYEGANPNFSAFLNVPALDWLQFKAYYTRHSIEGWDDIFKLDERSLLVAEGRYQLVENIYLVGRWTRQWEQDPDSGDYEEQDNWNVGVEAAFQF